MSTYRAPTPVTAAPELEPLIPNRVNHVAAPQPEDEEERLNFLRSMNILDTVPDEAFDDITTMLSKIYNLPIALVSLVDAERQWFKSVVGLSVCETSRNVSFCAHLLLPPSPEILLVPDAQRDPRFRNNPLVLGDPFIRFYCGAPIILQGHRLGSLCMIDRIPRTSIGKIDTMLLANLADIIAGLIEREQTQVQQYDMVHKPSFLMDVSQSDTWNVRYMNGVGKKLLNWMGSEEPNFLEYFQITPEQRANISTEETSAMRCVFDRDKRTCMLMLYPSTRHNLGTDVATTVVHPYAEPTPSAAVPSIVDKSPHSKKNFMFGVVKFIPASGSPPVEIAAKQSMWFSMPEGMIVAHTVAMLRSVKQLPRSIVLCVTQYCGACSRFAEFFAVMCKEIRSAKFCVVSVDNGMDLVDELRHGSSTIKLPVIYFFSNGALVEELGGRSCSRFRQHTKLFLSECAGDSTRGSNSRKRSFPISTALGSVGRVLWPKGSGSKKSGKDPSRTGMQADGDGGGDELGNNAASVVDALSRRLQAERAHSRRLEELMTGSMAQEFQLLRQNHEASLARIELLQRDLNSRRHGHKQRQATPAHESINETEVFGEAAPHGDGRLAPFRFAGTLLNALMAVLHPCMVLIYGGPRAEMLEGDMRQLGIDARRQRNTKKKGRPPIVTVGRRGRSLAILDVVDTWSPQEMKCWFSEVSDALPIGGIFAVVSADPDLLDLLAYFASSWMWEATVTEGTRKDYWILSLRKSGESDAAIAAHSASD